MKIYRVLFLAVPALIVLSSPRILLAGDDSGGGNMYDNGSKNGNGQNAPLPQNAGPSSPGDSSQTPSSDKSQGGSSPPPSGGGDSSTHSGDSDEGGDRGSGY